MIRHPSSFKDERHRWVEDPVTQALIKRGAEKLDEAIHVLLNAALASSDPKIVKLGSECYCLNATLQMLSGTLKEEEEKKDA